MNVTAMIVSIISVIGCLILATRSSALRQLGTKRMVVYALMWGAIIVALVLVIEVAGLRIAQ